MKKLFWNKLVLISKMYYNIFNSLYIYSVEILVYIFCDKANLFKYYRLRFYHLFVTIFFGFVSMYI